MNITVTKAVKKSNLQEIIFLSDSTGACCRCTFCQV